MGEYTRRAIIVVPAARQAEANAKAALLDTEGGSRTFIVGLSSTGEEPATQYWCSAAAKPEHWDAIVSIHGFIPDGPAGRYADTGNPVSYLYDGILWTPDMVLTDLGLQRVVVKL